jgi:uncharacterized protein (DUF302 family)
MTAPSPLLLADDRSFGALVLDAEGPVLVDFCAPEHDPCRSQQSELERFAEGNPGVRVVRLDVAQAPSIAARYAVHNTPTLLVFQGGRPITGGPGPRDEKSLASLVHEAQHPQAPLETGMHSSRYAKAIDVNLGHEAAIETVTRLLKEEGFGVLTTIDVRATLKEKLDAEVEPYTILGACNPPFAHEALQAEEAVGILMPCNVVVKALDEGRSRVFFTDVQALFSLINREDIAPIATEVNARLTRVRDQLAG